MYIQIVNSLEDIYELKGCLSAPDIHWLRSSMEHLKSEPGAVKDRAVIEKKKNKLFMIHEKTNLRSEVENLFRSHFPDKGHKYRVHSANFYELETPYGLHCDNLGADIGFYQAVIPLDIQPEARPTYTIIFDQTADINSEWVSPIYKKPKDYKPFHNIPIFEANWFGGWSEGYKISEDDGVKYWGPTWDLTFRESYKGFSIKHAYRWSPGDIFIFNSKYTHCASELSGLGIQKKAGLLMCLAKV